MELLISVSLDGGFSKDADLLFEDKVDLLNFKKITLNNVIFMGVNTFSSINRLLESRINIVVSDNFSNIKFSKKIKVENISNLQEIITKDSYESLYVISKKLFLEFVSIENEVKKEIPKNFFVIGGKILIENTNLNYDKIHITVFQKIKTASQYLDKKNYIKNRNEYKLEKSFGSKKFIYYLLCKRKV